MPERTGATRRRDGAAGPLIAAMILAVCGSIPARAGDDTPQTPADPEMVRFFEAEVRPLLAERCLKCHGPDRQKGGLRLDSRDAALEGGNSGPAVVPGHVDESLLVEAIGYDTMKMPPDGQLGERQRAALSRWIEAGAPWPGNGAAAHGVGTGAGSTGHKPGTITDDDRAFWSFRPLTRPEPPTPADPAGWCRNPIDRFVLARLQAEGLDPAPEATRRTLIRRLTFDLHGLPPTPEEVERFVADPAPDAYERLVDRLLESPRYGERWGRHWLDLVRYADSDGYRQDAYRPDIWRYRDYVIDAFNRDVPYDQFVREQLAGDEIDPDDPRLRVATGYLRLGTYEYNQRDVPAQWAAILDDLTDVTSDVFMGLGLSCARCHDHKFDPLLQADYYRLRSFFAALRPRDDLPMATASAEIDQAVESAAWDLATAEIRDEMAAIEAPHRRRVAEDAITKFPAEMQAMIRRPREELSLAERQLVELAFRQVTYEWDHIDTHIKGADKKRYDALKKQLAEFDAVRPKPLPGVMAAMDIGPVAPPMTIPGARDAEPIPPGFPTILEPLPAAIPTVDATSDTTGRRSALADWIARPDNRLSTRVAVNRIWQHHLGRGLVATPSDFGRLGEPPTHPELLDWLATEFVARGWSMKAMHRLILASATYRQDSARSLPEVAMRVDPDARLLWRQSVRRLEAEPIRDAMLAASGELELAAGGPPAEGRGPRRSVYTKLMRNSPDPFLDAFDAPDGSTTTPTRNLTTTPTQSLLLLNGDWPLARAGAFADRLVREESTDAGRVDRAFRLALGRPPDASEEAASRAFLESQRALDASNDREALVDFCHALINSSEFLYVD